MFGELEKPVNNGLFFQLGGKLSNFSKEEQTKIGFKRCLYTQEELENLATFFKLQSIAILAIRRQR